ncbi:hypothetical protein P153DRAFT_285814 [Dothidotthia symphoricarpi CBS 119687]|uniref:Uncharacterized protein n=1 Tax=Dothidotthia symphoricarpi CBS 119687 TaxID=1392245 RepID=A0A6A6APF8_9PLEO|nr:uncharacterized protein P153DRAFT_285814 [Dothidotthia symphoricarpi CBS 119687]KAF2132391.1 hypothetical protein P153DRAFT_285814 [Dothidotthia symphoricarpi CBS 119687]
MANFKAHLSPYYLEAALAEDRRDIHRPLIIDVDRNDMGKSAPSLELIKGKINDCLLDIQARASTATKLYVIGGWNLTPQETNNTEASKMEWRTDMVKREWREATEKIAELISSMTALKELTWISGLPFMACVWEKLPTTLTKLVLDLGQPVRLEQDGDVQYKSYITTNEMKPLQHQTMLKELRLLRLYDSLQCVVWETVFRNKSRGGIRVLDLQMAAAPLVRLEHWRQAKDVVGLTVPNEECKEKEYKGLDGIGALHYSVGTGEYLDDFCMRKARIASGVDEAIPLPLWCLKLDGFVVDHLPFQQELSRIVLLTCGSSCVDAGLRAPQTSQAPLKDLSALDNHTPRHCVIQWPRWTGIFDDQGEQCDSFGNIASQDAGLSTPLDEHTPNSPVALTAKNLDMKAMTDALTDLMNNSDKYSGKSSGGLCPTVTMSNLSYRGSEVPTVTDESVPAVDGSTTDDSPPASCSNVMSTDASSISASPPSTDEESFEILSLTHRDAAMVDDSILTNTDSKAPQPTGPTQDKVR